MTFTIGLIICDNGQVAPIINGLYMVKFPNKRAVTDYVKFMYPELTGPVLTFYVTTE